MCDAECLLFCVCSNIFVIYTVGFSNQKLICWLIQAVKCVKIYSKLDFSDHC